MRNPATASGTGESLRKGDRLPAVGLTSRSMDGKFSLRPRRGPRVVVTLHDSNCDGCLAYARQIVAVRESIESWGADIVIVSPVRLEPDAVVVELGVPALEDPNRVVASGRLAVIIVDEWGEVYFASEPNETHTTIAAEDVVEWVKFVAIQCPECEGPEGEWRHP